MNVSFAITTCNENEELDRLLSILSEYIGDDDEVVVLRDVGTTEEVVSVLEKFENIFDCDFKHDNIHDLAKDFASHKNHLNSLCTRDYIFQIDADEYPSEDLLQILPQILELNKGIDLILVPRINTVNGLTEDHINRWGWRVNDSGWVNFPDYQWRIYRNDSEIYWINRVHERIVGFDTFTELPAEEEFCLYHPKDIERQVAQNELYGEIMET